MFKFGFVGVLTDMSKGGSRSRSRSGGRSSAGGSVGLDSGCGFSYMELRPFVPPARIFQI